MVRTVSGASEPPQKAEKAAPLSGEKAVKALGTDEKLLDAQVAIAESLAKARAVDAPPVAASGPRDLGASKDVIAKLEAFAKTMSAQVKARPMAQDVAARFRSRRASCRRRFSAPSSCCITEWSPARSRSRRSMQR